MPQQQLLLSLANNIQLQTTEQEKINTDIVLFFLHQSNFIIKNNIKLKQGNEILHKFREGRKVFDVICAKQSAKIIKNCWQSMRDKHLSSWVKTRNFQFSLLRLPWNMADMCSGNSGSKQYWLKNVWRAIKTLLENRTHSNRNLLIREQQNVGKFSSFWLSNKYIT